MAKLPPWKNPRKQNGRRAAKLSTASKATVKRRAKKAGHRYPNLVDNMREAAQQKKQKARKP